MSSARNAFGLRLALWYSALFVVSAMAIVLVTYYLAQVSLTERDREVLLLWDAGLSYDEISTETGLARGAVGTTLSRARRRLVEAHEALEDRDAAHI